MKVIHLIMLFVTFSFVSNAQWNPSGADQNTSIYRNGNIAIGTNTANSSVKMFISSSTTSSGDNTLRLEAPAIGSSSSHVHWGLTGDWFIRSAVSSGRVILQDAGGKVGIGTATPRGKFDVDGPGDIYLSDDVTSGTSQNIFLPGSIYINPWSGTDISYIHARRSDNSGTSALRIRTVFNGTTVEPMHIEGNGYVGIGSNSPSAQLHIQGSSVSDGSTNLNIVNGANTYGRTQLRLTGRLHNDNDGWNLNGRSNILFATNAAAPGTSIGSIGADQFAIQHNMLTNELGVLSATKGSTPLMIIRQSGNIGILGGLKFDQLVTLTEGTISEWEWGNYIIGDVTNTAQRSLRLGVSNDGFTRAEIFIDNGNRSDGTIAFKTTNANGGTLTRMFVHGNGNVGIGTINPDTKLAVKGTIHTEEVRVDVNVPVPDYVFEKDYNLLPLSEVEAYVNQNKHLPEVPSAKEMEENGLNLKEMNLLLLKKVEELTLHLIEMKKENEMQQKQIDGLSNNRK